jgi:hypothetical protein
MSIIHTLTIHMILCQGHVDNTNMEGTYKIITTESKSIKA